MIKGFDNVENLMDVVKAMSNKSIKLMHQQQHIGCFMRFAERVG